MYGTAAEALSAARTALDRANTLVLNPQIESVTSGNVRREIDHELLTYQRAIGAYARLTHRERVKEHSLKLDL